MLLSLFLSAVTLDEVHLITFLYKIKMIVFVSGVKDTSNWLQYKFFRAVTESS